MMETFSLFPVVLINCTVENNSGVIMTRPPSACSAISEFPHSLAAGFTQRNAGGKRMATNEKDEYLQSYVCDLTGLFRPPEEGELGSDNIRGRAYFLWAIQEHWPEFWRRLKSEVFDKCQPLPEDRTARAYRIALALNDYLPGVGVKDTWLVDACCQTVINWRSHPPETLLTAKHQVWFLYASNEPVIPMFEFQITDQPRHKNPAAANPTARRVLDAFGHGMEGPSEFRERMTAAFTSQLSAYVALCRKRTAARESMETHAAWAALMMSGQAAQEIAESWQGLGDLEDPEYSVYKQASRFADEIGLSRKGWQKKSKRSVHDMKR
jgi:hypothetical protein